MLKFMLFIVLPLALIVGVTYYADHNRVLLLFGIYPAIFAYAVGMMAYTKI